jgi:alpha-beta hydrolase superfamily lysophospholipase
MAAKSAVEERHFPLDRELPSTTGAPRRGAVTYLERATDSSHAVIYLHGMGQDAEIFARYMSATEAHGVALTLPGFADDRDSGLAPVPLDTHVDVVSRFVAEICRQHPGKAISLVGFSLGADMILRLAERWVDDHAGPPAVAAALLLDPNVNQSTMNLSGAFATADPGNPLALFKQVTGLASDTRREHQLQLLLQYVERVMRKDFRQIQRHAQDFFAYWDKAGYSTYDLFLQRLGTLIRAVPCVRAAFSGDYRRHLDLLTGRLRQLPGLTYDLMADLDHFELIDDEALSTQLGELLRAVGPRPRRLAVAGNVSR